MELALVGAERGGGFANTNELEVMNCKEAMQCPDRAAWEEQIENDSIGLRNSMYLLWYFTKNCQVMQNSCL